MNRTTTICWLMRTVRKLTIQRNSLFHCSCDASEEMATTYHSIISTVKLLGCSKWNFIRTFFTNIFNDAGIISTWFLTKSPWISVNVKFKTNYLTKNDFGTEKCPFKGECPKLSAYSTLLIQQLFHYV